MNPSGNHSSSSSARPLSKTEYVVTRLREDIAAGLIDPGHALRQNSIAKRYGVSATPVREALRILASDGTVTYSPHHSATVAEIDKVELDDLYLLRSTTEVMVTGLAASRATPEQIASLWAIQEQLRELSASGDGPRLSLLNRTFHMELLRIGSPFIVNTVIEPLWTRFMPTSVSIWRDPVVVERFLMEHELILHAMENGERETACKHMESHLDSAARQRLMSRGLLT